MDSHNYLEDVYKKDFTAEIIDVCEKDGKYHIELDNTYFYPGSSAEPCDEGSINDAPVTFVYQDSGKIFHVTETKPIKIHRVKCSINFNKRYDFMKQHLGEHILSACIFRLFGSNTVGHGYLEDGSYIDIDKFIEYNDLIKAEEMAKEAISDNISIESLYPTKAELKKLPVRKTPFGDGTPLRVVKIGDLDMSFCNCLHPQSTIEVQLIKILRAYKHKTGTRLEFICGRRAAADYNTLYENWRSMSSLLNCSTDLLFDKVKGLRVELSNALSERSALKESLAEYEVQNLLKSCEYIKQIGIVKLIHHNTDIKHVKLLASKLTSHPNIIVLFAAAAGDTANLLFMCSRELKAISMNSLLKDAITLIDGKGGGNDFSAQGAGKNNNNLDSCMEYAFNKIKNSI